jgi:hypothetical protein
VTTPPTEELDDPGEELTTLARVNRALSRPLEDQQALEVLEAVNSLVPTFAVPRGVVDEDGTRTWAKHQRTGATLLAARLERRKDSPGGLATFGIEGGAYVQGNWADVAMMLGIGPYSVGRTG